MKWNIDNIEFTNNAVLAPIAGITNPAFIKLCENFNLKYAITELISAEAIIRNSKKTFDMLNGIEKINIPVAVQIFGGNVNSMAEAAKILVDKFNIKVIDINMGCPVPKVALRSQAGACLLKNPKKVYELVKAVVESVDIPVTVKIRSGWDKNSINCVEIAKIIEKAGAKAITLHARTRNQGYSGNADWSLIKKVKDSVNIPVIGNGDIKSIYDAKKMIDETHCDAVMIGRACIGNPWLINECIEYINNGKIVNTPTNKEKIDTLVKHYNLLKENSNEKHATLEIKNCVTAYLKNIPYLKEFRLDLVSAKNEDDFMKIISEIYTRISEIEDINSKKEC